MGKRRPSNEDSDFELPQLSTSSKRARVQDDDDEPVREEESEDQRNFEQRFGEKVRASIEAKQNYQGRIAECGIIQSLEMQQFMCHARLSFTFGPQINFIIGHNGSGKSAVLSALTIALGGKAITTGRGSGLKAFIQEGKTWSEVTVTIKNEGPEAYRPEAYGKSIVVTRNFTKSGSSGYKIKSKDGKVISTKKEELAKICDHMNIQVDNPMNVLSQDSARQFIASSKPSDIYELFLKGTQLRQLSEEYESCLENIGKTYKILEAKKDALPDLKKAVVDAESRHKGAKLALQTKERLKELKQEQAWAHVQAKEDEMKSAIEEVAKKSRKAQDQQSKLDAARKEHATYSETVVGLEQKMADLGDIDNLSRRKAEIGDKIRTNKHEIRKYVSGEKDHVLELKTTEKTIEDFRERIASETKKLQEDKKAEQEERQRNLNNVKNAISEHEARRNEINDQLRQINEDQGPLKVKVAEVETVMGNHKATMEHCSRRLHELKQQAFDRFAVFGRNLPQVHQQINSMQWHGDMPVGPLGLFVTLHDRKWAELMRATLGQAMTSFAVTDARDRVKLRKILVESNNAHMQVIVSASDRFDYSSGEPPADKLTVLRALKITDEYVTRILINQSRIERTLLAESRAEGARLAEEARGGTALCADLYRVTAYPDGGSYSVPLQELKLDDHRQRYFAYDDPEAERRHWRERGQQAANAFDQAKTDHDKYKKQLGELGGKSIAYKNEAQAAEHKLFTLKQSLRNMQSQHNEDMPVNIASLEQAMKEAEEAKESVVNQYRDLLESKMKVETEQRPLLEELNKIKAQIDEFEAKRTDLVNEIAEAAGKRRAAQAKIDDSQAKLSQIQKEIENLEDAARNLQEEYENWTRDAEEFCDGRKIDNPRKLAEVTRQLESVQTALKRQEKENGATIEQLEETLVEARQKYHNMEKDLKHLQNLNKLLKMSVIRRLERWHDFRRHIALRTKLQFQHHLAMRGYFGKVLFDHERQRLELKVQTDDQAATQGLNKDPKSLSGGEKSFATICLLLALWEAIGCPIRCLDEFDVFMDAVNRRISMRMMVDTANASDSKQYILITPQDMSSISFGPSVRVHRMGDPERGQTTL